MSVLCSLTQISSHLLQRIIEFPSVLELVWGLAPMDSEEEKIANIDGVSPEYTQLLSEILVEPEQAVGQLALSDLEELEDWRLEYLEDYQLLKSEIYQILIEGKTSSDLDLNRSWDDVGYIFRGSVYSKSQSFLVHNTVNEGIMVEVIFGGEDINEDPGIRYLKSAEVREIAGALSNITEEVICKRFEQDRKAQPKPYFYNWSEEDYQGILQICLEVKDFYINAANQGKGILISLG